MNWKTLTSEVSTSLGLKAATTSASYFGKVDSYPAQMYFYEQKNAHHINIIIRFFAENIHQIIHRNIIDAFNEDKTFKPKNLIAQDGSLAYTFIKGAFDKRGKEDLFSQVKKIIEIIKSSGANAELRCQSCSTVVKDPLLLNGALTGLCDQCIEKTRHDIERAAIEHKNKKINYPFVVLAGLVAAVAGAALWAGITILTGKMYAYIAILNGLAVGYAMLYTAGKKTTPILVGIVLLTICSVLAGNLEYFAYVINKDLALDGDSLDLEQFIKYAPQILIEDPSGTLFAGVCGLFGAGCAFKLTDKFSIPVLNIEKLN